MRQPGDRSAAGSNYTLGGVGRRSRFGWAARVMLTACAVTLAVHGAGCGRSIGGAARAAAGPTVDESIRALSKKQNQDALAELARTPGTQKMAYDVGRAMGRGQGMGMVDHLTGADSGSTEAGKPVAEGKADAKAGEAQTAAARSGPDGAAPPQPGTDAGSAPPTEVNDTGQRARELSKAAALGVADAAGGAGETLDRVLRVATALAIVGGLFAVALVLALIVLGIAFYRGRHPARPTVAA